MVDIPIATGNARTAKIWSEKLYQDIPKESFFGDFMSTNKDSIVNVYNDLIAKAGDTLTVGLLARDTDG